MKKTIRLTESDLHKLIGESVKRILSEGNAWADQQPIDKNHPDWWYYRQEIEPNDVEDFDDEPIGESKLRNIVRESVKRVMNEELSDKVKRSIQMASDWIDVDNNNRMLTDFTPDMYSPNYRGNNNVYDLSNDVSPLGHKRHEEMNDAWGEHERNESKIRNIVRESIKRVINEEWYPENENDIDDYYYGAIFKFNTDLVYFDEDEKIPEDLLNIKDEYIESENTYASVMVTNVEPEVDETDGSASFTITAAINAPNMPLDEIEEEVTNTVWVWIESKLNKSFTRVWIEGEEVVYDRRSVE